MTKPEHRPSGRAEPRLRAIYSTIREDDIARAIIQLAGSDLPVPVSLSPEEREAIARSKTAAGSGEFATDEQVRGVWAKHDL